MVANKFWSQYRIDFPDNQLIKVRASIG